MRTAAELRAALGCAALAMTLALAGPASAAAEPAPALYPSSLATPTNFIPGDEEGEYSYDVRVANLGAAPTDGGDITVTDTLPAGVEVKAVQMLMRTATPGAGHAHDYGPPSEGFCVTEGPSGAETVTCTISEAMPEAVEPATLQPYEERRIAIAVFVPEGTPEGPVSNQVTVSGGGAPAASIAVTNRIDSRVAEGGLSFSRARLTGPDGQPLTQAGAHPYQFVSSFAVHTKPGPEGAEAAFLPAGGDVKDIEVKLPPGLAGNPTAPTRCTRQQFNTVHGITVGSGFYNVNACPQSSAVGMVLLQQVEGRAGIVPLPLYNLVPPPGMPAQLGFQVFELPFYIDTEVRPEDGYRVVGTLHNLSELKRVTASSVVLWGDPASELHDAVRGRCINELEYTPITAPGCEGDEGASERSFLRLPTSCTEPLNFLTRLDSWTRPGAFYEETSPGLTPTGCDQLAFEPGFRARPTTNVADSPSGLEAEVSLPQSQDPTVLGEADLRKAVVALPEGLVVNPAGANGLGGLLAPQTSG